MTREDVKKQFPDATDEQITAILNMHNSEVQKQKDKVAENKTELDRLKGVEKELEDLKGQNLTAEQKLEAELKKTAEERAKYTKLTNRVEVEKILVQAGLTEEDYKDFIDGLVTEDLEASKKMATTISTTLKNKMDKAGKDKEAELLDNLDDKGGKDKDADTKTEAEKFAEAHAKQVSGASSTTNDILNAYLGG